MTVDSVIILAAGRGHQTDGLVKVLIRHPATGRSILDHAMEAFAGKRITVVVGYRAIEVMEAAPTLEYVINYEWSLTNNAMSLGLALGEEPTYVVSGDIFLERPLIDELDAGPDNLILTENRENRSLTAIHCVTHGDTARELYQGPLRDAAHPEAVGLFKISDRDVLRRWKRACVSHSNLFVGQTLPCDVAELSIAAVGSHPFVEINTPADYLRLVERCNVR